MSCQKHRVTLSQFSEGEVSVMKGLQVRGGGRRQCLCCQRRRTP